MKVQILQMLEGAKKAEGLTVIIDVFRAFSLECYLVAQGAEEVFPIGTLEEAFALKAEDPENRVLFGERGGARVEGCEYGNSPSQAAGVDFTGKTILHTTSAGTQGIVNATGASEILTGALVNARAIADYILAQDPEIVSLVAMGNAGLSPNKEDTLCAEYIRSLLLDEDFDMESRLASLRTDGGQHFFNPDTQEIYPQPDFFLATRVDCFPFVLKVEKEDGRFVTHPLRRFIHLPHSIYSKDEYGRILAEIRFPEEEKGLYNIERTYVCESLFSVNLAEELVDEALLQIRKQGGRVKADCPFAKQYLEKKRIL